MKNLALVLIPVVAGWALGVLGTLAVERFKRSSVRRDTARLLLSEVRFNQMRAESFAKIFEADSSGPGIKDEHGRPVPLPPEFLERAQVLPGPFSFSVFDATLQRQAVLDKETMDVLHQFYRTLRLAEQLREFAERINRPGDTGFFRREAANTIALAAKLAAEKTLLQKLEDVAR